MDAQQNITINDLMASNIGNQVSASKTSDVSEIRREALQQAAATVGAQAGLLARAKETNAMLENEATNLDRIFDFNVMMVQPNVIAPVLTEGRSTYSQTSEDEIRIADRMYKIEAPAKFVSNPPTWRNYLQQNVTSTKVEMPHGASLPKNSSERKIWDEWVQKGWNEGIEQSTQLYEQGLARMRRDYLGMIQYKILLKQGLVSAPIVSRANLGTTGGGNEMNLQDRVFKITVPSNLVANPKDWKNYPVE